MVDLKDDGTVIQESKVPWPLTALSLQGQGNIGGLAVDCVSLPAQIEMHQGYELPLAQQHDLDVLWGIQLPRSAAAHRSIGR